LRFLIDTNVLIPLEPVSPAGVEEGTGPAATFIRLSQELGHAVYIHPAGLAELAGDKDALRRSVRQTLAQKYVQLPDPPGMTAALASVLGDEGTNAHDRIDNLIIAAAYGNAVDHLVTEDAGIHRKARRVGIDERVLRVAEAVGMLQRLFQEPLPPPPSVRRRKAHALDPKDAIFTSLRADYGGDAFDLWLSRCQREHRDAFVVEGPTGECAALAILKRETQGGDSALRGDVLKISTLKVAEEYNGNKYGELLLKAIFEEARSLGVGGLYVTVFEKHQLLITLLEDFGFEAAGARTALGELLLQKSLRPTQADGLLNDLEYHVKYGPPLHRVREGRAFLVPIKPIYHRMLFPDAERALQLSLAPGPYGNALKKAYLCHAATRQLQPGDTLLFYRSGDAKSVTAVGVLEDALVSADPIEVARFVGKRTVYDFEQIEGMSQRREILALLFRQATLLDDPIDLAELQIEGKVRQWPQTVSAFPREGTEWLRGRLGLP